MQPDQLHHLRTVLRLQTGDRVDYTDGAGTVGRGTWREGTVRRGREDLHAAPSPRLTMAVAPPRERHRLRFLVEKLAELGVDRLAWLSTRRGTGKAAAADKLEAWAQSALEQSRGAWAMELAGAVTPADLGGTVLVADPGGGSWPPTEGDTTVVIGPEGGLARDEIGGKTALVGLGGRILRVETAAVVGAVRFLTECGRLETGRYAK